MTGSCTKTYTKLATLINAILILFEGMFEGKDLIYPL